MEYNKIWNKSGYYEILKKQASLIVEIDTELVDDLIIKNARRYVRMITGDFEKVIDDIDKFMDFSNDNKTILVKLPYRYNKYNVIFENEDQTLATSCQIQKNVKINAVIELKGGNNNDLYWNVLKIIFK